MKIPTSIADVTSEWLNGALERSVVDCRALTIGAESGFASQIIRVEVTYDADDCPGPPSLIVKLATSSDDEQRSDMLREKNRSETAFYREIGTAACARVPHCYFVLHDETTSDCVLVLEDLRPARFGDAAKGCSPEDAERVVDLLAGMHARWWNDPRLDDFGWLPRFGKISERMKQLPGRRDAFLHRHGDLLPDDVLRLTQRIGPQHAQLLERVGGPPETLLHVDTHLDNIAFLESGSDVETVLFDCQGVSKGLCTVDIALFLSGALVGDERAETGRLLRRYHNTLRENGITDYLWEQFRNDYRIALLRWWIGTIGGLGSDYAGTWTGRQATMAREGVEQWCDVIRDENLVEVLD